MSRARGGIIEEKEEELEFLDIDRRTSEEQFETGIKTILKCCESIHVIPDGDSKKKFESAEDIRELHSSIEQMEESERSKEGKGSRIEEIYEEIKKGYKELKGHYEVMLEEEKEDIIEQYNNLVYQIIQLERTKLKNDFQIYEKQIEQRKKTFERTKQQLEMYELDEAIDIRSIRSFFTPKEQEQIEKWTEMLLSSVLFDSEVDSWKTNENTLKEKIKAKEYVLFYIETASGDRFGFYVHQMIQVGIPVKEEGAFYYRLTLAGKEDCAKIDAKTSKQNWILIPNSGDNLISLENGTMNIKTQDKKNQCNIQSNRGDVSSILGRKTQFEVKRIVAFKMF